MLRFVNFAESSRLQMIKEAVRNLGRFDKQPDIVALATSQIQPSWTTNPEMIRFKKGLSRSGNGFIPSNVLRLCFDSLNVMIEAFGQSCCEIGFKKIHRQQISSVEYPGLEFIPATKNAITV